MGHGSNVVQFPTTIQQRIDRAAIEAVKWLAAEGMVPEGTAIRTLIDLGAHEDTIDHVRTLIHVGRGRL